MVDEQGRPRVLDFGLVRETELSRQESSSGAQLVDADMHEELTRDGYVVGTLADMPLEQLRGKPMSVVWGPWFAR